VDLDYPFTAQRWIQLTLTSVGRGPSAPVATGRDRAKRVRLYSLHATQGQQEPHGGSLSGGKSLARAKNRARQRIAAGSYGRAASGTGTGGEKRGNGQSRDTNWGRCRFSQRSTPQRALQSKIVKRGRGPGRKLEVLAVRPGRIGHRSINCVGAEAQ